MSTPASQRALENLRDLSTLEWYVIPFLAIVDRDLNDAIKGGVSADWHFLVLPTMPLSSSARSCFTLRAIRLKELFNITARFKLCHLSLDQKESRTRNTWIPVGSKGML